MFKLGLNNEQKQNELENKIINLKIELLDSSYTFNENSLNFNYLVKLHNYLFSDFYFFENNDIRGNFSIEEQKYIQKILNELNELGMYAETYYDKIIDYFKTIWGIQIFKDGNYRTLLAFFKVYCDIYNLEFNYNYNNKNLFFSKNEKNNNLKSYRKKIHNENKKND